MAYGTVIDFEGLKALCVAPGVFEALDSRGVPTGRFVYPHKNFYFCA